MKYPWMPLFWGDFLANTMHLSTHEIGAYLFLIAHAWEHDGEIPADWTRLARIAHVRPNHWKRTWKTLQKFFTPIESKEEKPVQGGPISKESCIKGYLHERVSLELRRLGKISSKRKDAAMQMHTRKRAKAHASTSTSKDKESANGQQSEVTPGWRPRIDDECRSPPRQKPDNDLTDPNRDDLKALSAKP